MCMPRSAAVTARLRTGRDVDAAQVRLQHGQIVDGGRGLMAHGVIRFGGLEHGDRLETMQLFGSAFGGQCRHPRNQVDEVVLPVCSGQFGVGVAAGEGRAAMDEAMSIGGKGSHTLWTRQTDRRFHPRQVRIRCESAHVATCAAPQRLRGCCPLLRRELACVIGAEGDPALQLTFGADALVGDA